MRGVKIVAGVIVGLPVLALIAVSFLPKDYAVERSITVNAPIEVVFDHVDDVEKQQLWSPWREVDPSIVAVMGPVTKGEGASFTWTSDDGGGSLTVTKVVPNERIEEIVVFDGMGGGDTSWTFTPGEGGVDVTWRMAGRVDGLIGGVIAGAMDSLVGPDFERGLKNLKRVAEAAVEHTRHEQ